MSLKTVNVLIVTIGVVVVVVAAIILGIQGNNAADRHRERGEQTCVSKGYQWVSENCLYPPIGGR